MTGNSETGVPTGYASTISKVIAGLTGATAIIGATLYLAGSISYTNRLSDLGVPPQMFPQGIEAAMVSGYYALLSRWTIILSSTDSWIVVGAALVFFAIAVFIYNFGEDIRSDRGTDGEPEQSSSWMKKALREMGFAVLIITAGVLASFGVTYFALVPGLLGELEGRANAKEILTCAEQNGRLARARTALLLGDKEVARGFVFAASNEHVAIYDIKANVVRTMSTSGLELRSLPFKERDAAEYNPDSRNIYACW